MTKRGMMLGVAYGDAIGWPNENKNYDELGRCVKLPDRLLVSDDTHMTLFLADALRSGGDWRSEILAGWQRWFADPERRGWGQTTITAVRALNMGQPWEAVTGDSNTCGAVMRVAPCASVPDWEQVTAWQAASTHGGPAAMAAALVAVGTLRNPRPGQMLAIARDLCADEQLVTKAAPAIIGHPRAPNTDAAVELLNIGMDMVARNLERALARLPRFVDRPWSADPSNPQDGAGWGFYAQQCLATALLCVDMLPCDPALAVYRAALTGGDSDSIGALTGMFMGSLHGDCWPQHWHQRLEGRIAAWISDLDRGS